MAPSFASKFWVSYHCPRFPIAALKSDLNCVCETKTQEPISTAEQEVAGRHLHFSLCWLGVGWGRMLNRNVSMPTSKLQVRDLGDPTSVCPGHPLTFSGPWHPALANCPPPACFNTGRSENLIKGTAANIQDYHKLDCLAELCWSTNGIHHLPVPRPMELKF